MSDDEGLAIAAGVVLGILGLAALIDILKKNSECPICKNKIEHGIQQCPHCGSWLKWQQ
jgi:hypothetical protein